MKKVIIGLILFTQTCVSEGMKEGIKLYSECGRIPRIISSLREMATNSGNESEIKRLKLLLKNEKEALVEKLSAELKKCSYTPTENKENIEKLLHLLSLDNGKEPVEVRFVNTESIIQSLKLSSEEKCKFLRLLQSRESLRNIFEEICSFEDDNLKEEVLKEIEECCSHSEIFRNKMICFLASSKADQSLGYSKMRIKRGRINSYYWLGKSIQREEEVYVRSMFKGTNSFPLEGLDIFGVQLSKKWILFHECGHAIAPVFNWLPFNILNAYDSYVLDYPEDEQSYLYYDVASKMLPISFDTKKIDEKLSSIATKIKTGAKPRPADPMGFDCFTYQTLLDNTNFIYGSEKKSIERNDEGEITAEVITRTNPLGEVTIKKTKNYEKINKEDEEIDILKVVKNFNNFQIHHLSNRNKMGCYPIYKDGKIINEAVTVTSHGERIWSGVVHYKYIGETTETHIDELDRIVNLSKEQIIKKMSSPAFIAQMMLNSPGEIWQIIGLACVKSKNGTTLYINELSDFVLSLNLGTPIRADHLGGLTENRMAIFAPTYAKFRLNFELYDALFKIYGSSLNEYLDKLSNGKSTTLEMYISNLLYPYGLSSLLKNEYRLMKPLMNNDK